VFLEFLFPTTGRRFAPGGRNLLPKIQGIGDCRLARLPHSNKSEQTRIFWAYVGLMPL
jgi:hypothetical protein